MRTPPNNFDNLARWHRLMLAAAIAAFFAVLFLWPRV
jgi:hypothetical protein